MAKTTDAAVKQQMGSFKVYKSAEPMSNNALYVVVVDPAIKDSEYELFAILQKVLTPEELRDPDHHRDVEEGRGARSPRVTTS